MSRYAVTVPLHRVAQDTGDEITDSLDAAMEHLVGLEACEPALLDCAISAGGTFLVRFEVTVEAEFVEEAVRIAVNSVRAALHAVGAGTPGWEDVSPSDWTAAYELSDEGLNARPLVTA